MPTTLTEPATHAYIFLQVFSIEGGIQSYVQDILQVYQTCTETVTADVFILRDRSQDLPSERYEALRFHCFSGRWLWLGRLQLAQALLAYLGLNKPDRVFCGHVLLLPLVQRLCQFFKIPYTVLTYGKEVWVPLPKLTQRALQQAAAVWTISRYSRDRACEANGLNPHKVQFLPCTIDGDRFTPGPKSQVLIEKYKLADSYVLMTVARLWSGDIYKGVDVTIRALPKILAHQPNVKYLVIGRGDDQPRLAKLAEDLQVVQQVIFVGFVPTEDLVEHYRLADVYVMPSQEGFGIVYLEAMACGLPVIAGDSDGSADPLQDGQLGWQVPHRDPEATAQACLEALSGQERRCDGVWLREQALAIFGKSAFEKRVRTLLT